MRAQPARRIATSALCALLLAGITGPAALAADSSHERGAAAASGEPRPAADALLAKVRKLDRQAGPLTPVAGLMEAVLEADRTPLTRAEISKLGQAAKEALTKAADDDDQPLVTIIQPEPLTPATGVVLTTDDTEVSSDELDELLDALEDLLDLLLADGISTADPDDLIDVAEDAAVEDTVTEDAAVEDTAAEDADVTADADDLIDDLVDDALDEAEDALDEAEDATDDAEDATDDAEDAADEADDLIEDLDDDTDDTDDTDDGTDATDDLIDDELAAADEELASADALIDALLADVDALLDAVLTPGTDLPDVTIGATTPSTPTPLPSATTLPAPVLTASLPVVTLPAV